MKIRTLGRDAILGRDARHELVDVIQLIVDAFIDLPESHYLIPDPDRRRDILFRYITVGARMMWERGATVNIIDDPLRQGPLAAAVWLPMPAENPTQAEIEAMNDAIDTYIERFETLNHWIHMIAAPTQPNEPHHELAWLAVRPDQQNRGMGSALLQHAPRRPRPDQHPSTATLHHTRRRTPIPAPRLHRTGLRNIRRRPRTTMGRIPSVLDHAPSAEPTPGRDRLARRLARGRTARRPRPGPGQLPAVHLRRSDGRRTRCPRTGHVGNRRPLPRAGPRRAPRDPAGPHPVSPSLRMLLAALLLAAAQTIRDTARKIIRS